MHWLDDEDELYMDTLEILQEARADVDKKYPRVKDNQITAIMALGVLNRWFAAHKMMHSIENYFEAEEVN